MASTQILAFTTEAAGSGGNRLSPTAYAALTTLLEQGFQAGTAQSVQVNTVLAQTSFMAAGLANWMVAQGISVPDDGNLTNLVSEISAALTTFNATTAGRSVVGSMRNGKMSVTTASATATFTADEIIVESALGGSQYQLASFSQTLNTGTTGAGGMDTGVIPTSGFLAIYAIYNPTTNTQSILGVNATISAAPSIYAGAHMPSGYTASALISVIPTNSTPAIAPFIQNDRFVGIPSTSILSTTTNYNQQALTFTASPLNAKTISGVLGTNSTSGANASSIIVSPSNLTTYIGAVQNQSALLNTTGVSQSSYSGLQVLTPQTVYITTNNGGATGTFTMTINGYSF